MVLKLKLVLTVIGTAMKEKSNKQYYTLFFLLSLFVYSCAIDNNDLGRYELRLDYLEIEGHENGVVKLGESDSATLILKSKKKWDIECDSDWLKASPISGNGDSVKVTISAKENPITEKREGQIVVKSGTIDRRIKVEQKPKVLLNTPDSVVKFNYRGGSQTIKVECNYRWEIKNDMTWLKMDTLNGAGVITGEGNKELNIEVDSTIEERSGQLLVKTFGRSQVTHVIKVKQSNKPVFRLLEGKDVRFSEFADTITRKVRCEGDFELYYSPDWVKYSKERMADREYEIKVWCDVNISETAKKDTLVYQMKDYKNIKLKIPMYQAAKTTVEPLDPPRIREGIDTCCIISFRSNVDWKIEVLPDWMEPNNIFGSVRDTLETITREILVYPERMKKDGIYEYIFLIRYSDSRGNEGEPKEGKIKIIR